MTGALRRVVMTGAAGGIGTAISPGLAGNWDLVLTDRLQTAPFVLDITDGQACRRAFAGADAVVHLAGVPDPDASWEALQPANVAGVYEVACAAVDCGVRRLVLASSLQAVSAYPSGMQLRGSDAPRPANLYGATKAWAEAVGSWVAASSATTVVALRIGHFGLAPPVGEDATARNRAAWLSPGDCVELVRRAVEAEGVRFSVVNGISANRYRAAELSDGQESIGFTPRDDAWHDHPATASDDATKSSTR